MGTYYVLTWVVALVTGLWFSVVALRAKTSWALWGIGGGLLGLFITTAVLGLTEAAFIPLTNHQAAMFHLRAIVISIILIVLLGSGMTLNPYRRKT